MISERIKNITQCHSNDNFEIDNNNDANSTTPSLHVSPDLEISPVQPKECAWWRVEDSQPRHNWRAALRIIVTQLDRFNIG